MATPITSPLKTNLTPLTTLTTTADSLAKLVIVTPQTFPENTKGYQPFLPQTEAGVIPPLQPNFIFQYEGEQIVDVESDITDHFIEDNTALEDQISLRPETFKTSGYIGELTDLLPTFLQKISDAANLLLDVSGYIPQLSITAFVAYQEALLLYENAASIAQSAVNTWGSLTGNNPLNYATNNIANPAIPGFGNSGQVQAQPVQNLQQTAFQYFYGYWYARILFNIQTPWAIFTNMAIQSIRAVQDADTRMISDFEIVFKKIRVSSTVAPPQNLTQLRLNGQSAPPQNNGIIGISNEADFGLHLDPIAPAGQ